MPATTTLHISLSPEMRSDIEQKVSAHHYANPTDYIRDLVRRDIAAEREYERLRTLVEEGLRSGVSDQPHDAFMDELRTKIHKRAA